MKYWFDTEFIEDGRTIDLISIGMVAEDGRTLYLQNAECEFGKASDWVWRNVFTKLDHFNLRGRRACDPYTESYDSGLGRRTFTRCTGDKNTSMLLTTPGSACPWATRQEIAEGVLTFCDRDKHGKPEFWGYFSAYDWVALCQLFGVMIKLPKGWPMYCRDIKQWCDSLGNPQLPEQFKGEHNALGDAKWNKTACDYLKDYQVLCAK